MSRTPSKAVDVSLGSKRVKAYRCEDCGGLHREPTECPQAEGGRPLIGSSALQAMGGGR